MKPDPLDKVLREFQAEIDLAKAHEVSLHAYAATLLNPWRTSINTIIREMNVKLAPYSLRMAEAVGKFPDVGSAAGAALIIHAVEAQSIYDDRSFPPLLLTLTKAGVVAVSLSLAEGSRSFYSVDLQPEDPFPEDGVRRILADYIGYCLRHRSGDRRISD